jgi:hypothetical protein
MIGRQDMKLKSPSISLSSKLKDTHTHTRSYDRTEQKRHDDNVCVLANTKEQWRRC